MGSGTGRPREAVPWAAIGLMGCLQALMMGSVFGFLLLGGIIGLEHAPDPKLSTLPISAYVASAALVAVPLSMLMARRGRRAGFVTGGLGAVGAGLLCILSHQLGSFAAVVGAGLMIGLITASVGYLRFAALEMVPERLHGRAASVVLCGGILAASVGPHVPEFVGEAAGLHVHLALGLSLVALGALAAGVCLATRFAPPAADGRHAGPGEMARAARDLLRHRPFLRGAIASTAGYALMILVMHATPLTLTEDHGHSIGTAAAVMRNHYLGMFVPFLFSGILIDRLGPARVVHAGFALFAACLAILFVSSSVHAFHVALTLLGVGWNFTFLGGTKMVFASAPAGQGAAPQAVNECAIYTVNFVASMFVGWALFSAGWVSILVVAAVLGTVAPVAFALLGNGVRKPVSA